MSLEQRVVIRGEDRASAAFRSVGESAKSMGTRVFELTTTVSSLINIGRAAAAVMGNVAKAFAEPVRQALEAEKAQTLLAAKLRATGEQAGFTAVELNDLAARLAKVSTFGDDAIVSAEGLLLSFTNISRSGGGFERALQLSLDLGTQLGDLERATQLVGKALNDPIKGFRSLAEVGVVFTEAEKDVIKSLVEAGDAAAAQAGILTKLEGVYAGTAAAARDTFGGALAGLRNAWDDVLESMGNFIVKNEGVRVILDAIVLKVQSWSTALNEATGSLGAQSAAAEVFRTILLATIGITQGLLTTVGALASVVERMKVAFDAMFGDSVIDKVDALAKQHKELFKVYQEENDRLLAMRNAGEHWASSAEMQAQKVEELRQRLNALTTQQDSLLNGLGAVGRGVDAAKGSLAGLATTIAGLDLTKPAKDAAPLVTVTEEAAAATARFTDAMQKETGQAGLLEGALRSLHGMKQLLLGVQRQIAPEYDATRRRVQALLGELGPTTDLFEVWIGQWNQLRESAGGSLGGQLVQMQQFEKELAATVELSKSWREANREVEDAVTEIAQAHVDVQEPQQVVIENTRELAEAMREVQEEWERSVEAMTTTSTESFRDIFVDAFAGIRSLEEGFDSFSQTLKQQFATALLDPILGAQGPLAQLFNPIFSALKQIGTAIATQFIQPLISGFLSYIGVKTAAETTFAATATAAHAASAAAIGATTAATLGAMMPALTAAASAALVASFGGAAAAAGMLPGIIAAGTAQGAALAASLAAGAGAAAFAEGGRVTRPTFALVGEAGPETIIPEGRPDRARDLLDDLFARRPGLAGRGRGGAATVFINNHVNIQGTPDDPEDVAAQIYDAINRRLGRDFRAR